MRRQEKIVYAIRNKVNNKAYIGFCIDFKERKAAHIRDAKKKSKTHFHKALRKYGVENFEWIILFDHLGSIDNCKIMEKRMIALFDTYNNGYNGTAGGSGGNTYNGSNNSGLFRKGFRPWNTGIKLSEEHCKKLSDAHIGNKFSKEHKRKIGDAHKGTKRSNETRKRISIANGKKILQFSKNGNLIQTWESIKGAGEFTGIDPANISSVLRGITKTAGGFEWKYYKN